MTWFDICINKFEPYGREIINNARLRAGQGYMYDQGSLQTVRKLI